VLGSIALENLKSTLPYTEQGCFTLLSSDMQKWKLCSPEGKCPKALRDILDTHLGKTTMEKCPEENSDELLVVQPQIIIPVAAPDCKLDWNYNFHG